MRLDGKRLVAACAGVGAALVQMPGVKGTARHWSKRLAAETSGVREVGELATRIEAGEEDWNFALALLMRAALLEKPRKLRLTDLSALPTFSSEAGEFRVHHGDLEVKGNLSVRHGLIVTGDLAVGGVLAATAEYMTMLVCGTVTARGADIGKVQVVIGGALRISEALALTEGTVCVGDSFDAGLVIAWLAEVKYGGRPNVKYLFTDDDVQNYGRATRAKLEVLLASEIFDPTDADDDVLGLVHRLVDRMSDGASIWRPRVAERKARATLSSIPAKLVQAIAKSAPTVDLSGTRLSRLPPEIGDLSRAKKLDLGCNSLKTLPAEIGALTKLRELWLERNKLASLPAEIGALTRLELLVARDNALTSLPTTFARLRKLRRLDLADNALTSFPEEIFALDRLQELTLRGNPLTKIGSELSALKLLSWFSLGSEIRDLPDVFEKLENLGTLEIFGGQLVSIPRSLAAAPALRSLRLQKTALTKVPDVLLELSNLQELYLEFNPITTLPKLDRLANLITLGVSNMRLETIPDAVFELPKLTRVYAGDNRIRKAEQMRLYALAKDRKISLHL